MKAEISRPEFDAMNPHARAAHVRAGGVVTDPPPSGPAEITDKNVLTRAEFDALGPVERKAAALSGKRIADGIRVAPAQ
ncbi:MAG TPA: hypothetical protein PLD79_07705 [Halothiobacillus sp.]|nr:hypothetical protein [Halothiobacillus sp.]